jgi:cytidylate kinase
MGVVTISRWYGAGGRHVAEALADDLGFRVVDRDLVEAAATRVGMDPEVAVHLDERAPALIEKVGLALAAASPEFGVGAAAVEDRTLAESIRQVMGSLAHVGGYVILGRGGQAALHDVPDACHLKLVGDLEDRARNVARWQGISLEEARKRCRQVDAERADYVRRFFGCDIGDLLLYHAVLNTTRLGIEGATRTAAGIVRACLDASR